MRRMTLLFVSVLAIGCLASAATAERVQWKKEDGGNDHFYEPVVESMGIGFYDAQRAAEEKGGHLATIGSKEENDFVFKLVDDDKYWGTDDYNGYGPWIGAYQDSEAAKPDDGWSWITEEEWTYDNWSPGAGEPNDGDDVEDHAEDCAHYFCYGSVGREAKWNDSNELAPLVIGYVIEWTPQEELAAKKTADKPSEEEPSEEKPMEDKPADQSSESGEASGSN